MCVLAPRRSRIDFHHVVRVWLSSSSVDCNCSAEFLCMYGVDCVFCFLHCDRLQTQTSITQLNFVRPSPKAGMLTVRPLGCQQGRTRTSGVSVSSGRCHTSAGVTDGGVSTRVLGRCCAACCWLPSFNHHQQQSTGRYQIEIRWIQ